jgi:hypothetical protein
MPLLLSLLMLTQFEGHDRIVRQFGSCPEPVFATVPGSIGLDPRLNWYTLESNHFDVHFSCRGKPDSTGTGLAREVADICEEVYATLTPVVGWAPHARTQIVIADFYDYFNGWAAPFPNNTITVIPTPPAGSKSNEGDWLRTLILHEYSHILQMDRVAGAPKALRKVFGRIIMPNALSPAWLDEGYAVYNETRFTDFGRLTGAVATSFSGSRVAMRLTSTAPCCTDMSRPKATPASGTATTAAARPGFHSSRTTTRGTYSARASTTSGMKPRSA